ncbi:hypothetical protein LEN26_010398 [Aphanomyces euteiches]|nr:hypothetical protein LEN26_010398 [Aphanomyces euteiches]
MDRVSLWFHSSLVNVFVVCGSHAGGIHVCHGDNTDELHNVVVVVRECFVHVERTPGRHCHCHCHCHRHRRGNSRWTSSTLDSKSLQSSYAAYVEKGAQGYTQSNIAGYVANLGPYLDFMLERDQLAFEADSKEEYFMSPIPFNQGGSGGGGDGLLDEDILLHTSLISPSNSDGSSGSNN